MSWEFKRDLNMPGPFRRSLRRRQIKKNHLAPLRIEMKLRHRSHKYQATDLEQVEEDCRLLMCRNMSQDADKTLQEMRRVAACQESKL